MILQLSYFRGDQKSFLKFKNNNFNEFFFNLKKINYNYKQIKNYLKLIIIE